MFRHKTAWRSLGSANVYSIKEARDVFRHGIRTPFSG
jgi:hypothetical protein